LIGHELTEISRSLLIEGVMVTRRLYSIQLQHADSVASNQAAKEIKKMGVR
jgi:hypothetical protein